MKKKPVSRIMLASLLFVLVLGSFSSLLRAQPLEGNWDVTGVEVVENETIELSGNLTIKAGGTLTLRNVTLRMNIESNGQYGISVEEGGPLHIYYCNISSATEFRFFFSVVGGKFVMKNSELHDTGWGGGGDWGGEPRKRGLYIQADDAVIDGNLISNSLGVFLCLSHNSSLSNNILETDYGITITHNVWPYQPMPRDNFILNNTIQRSNEHGISIGAGNNNVVANNTIFDTMVGIMVTESWNNTIVNNHVFPEHNADPWGGIVLWGSCGNNTIANNTIKTETPKGIIDGIEVVRSVNNKIEGNIVENFMGGITLSYAHNNVVANNNISNIWRGTDSMHFYSPSANAIQLYHSSNNTIVNNQISRVQLNAILVWDMSKNNVVQSNIINSSYNGFSLHYLSDNNTIINNTVGNIESWTIILDESNENVAYGNNFLDTNVKAYDDGMNQWDFEGHGNYWGDDGGQDEDGNGISDTPYHIPPNGTDSFPLSHTRPITFVPIPIRGPASPPLSTSNPISAVVETEETWKDAVVTLQDMTVKNGGNLTLQNMTIMLCADSSINVEAGGSLYILNSNITAFDPNYGGYAFGVRYAKEFVMKDSELHYAGFCFQTDHPGGLYVLATNASIENNVFSHNYRAIWVTTQGYSGTLVATISNNTISHSYDGIVFDTGDVRGNVISDIIHAGVFESGGQHLAYNYFTQVWAGAIMLNWTGGVWIMGNEISSSETGVLLLSNVVNARILNNTIMNCTKGIYLFPELNSVIVYHNNVINSPTQCDYGSNSWDYNGEGNYWSDYTGVDVKAGSSQDAPGSDGIGDTPYIIDTDSIDHFPLMYPYGSSPPQTCSLLIAASNEGTTDPPPESYDYAVNSVVQVTAVPNAGFEFSYWLLDGETIDESLINVVMGTDRTLSSHFVIASAPMADAGPDQTVNRGASLSFDAGGSSDNVGIISYEWDFGDGQTGTGETVTHAYSNPGTYTVTLTVRDAAENTGSDSATVTVQTGQAFPWLTGGILIIVAVAIIVIYFLLIKKRM